MRSIELRHFKWPWVTFEGHFCDLHTNVTLCAQLMRDVLAIAKFLVLLFAQTLRPLWVNSLLSCRPDGFVVVTKTEHCLQYSHPHHAVWVAQTATTLWWQTSPEFRNLELDLQLGRQQLPAENAAAKLSQQLEMHEFSIAKSLSRNVCSLHRSTSTPVVWS